MAYFFITSQRDNCPLTKRLTFKWLFSSRVWYELRVAVFLPSFIVPTAPPAGKNLLITIANATNTHRRIVALAFLFVYQLIGASVRA